jgi:hypothetical protein
MSTNDHILLRCGLTPLEAAQRLATTLGLDLSTDHPPGTQVVSGPVPGRQSMSGGRVTMNYLGNEPGEPSIMDHYDVIWDIRTTDRDPEIVHAESLRLFALVTEKLPWPAMLYRDLTWLVAVWSPERGRHDFPDGVGPHSEDQHVWEPYIPSRW